MSRLVLSIGLLLLSFTIAAGQQAPLPMVNGSAINLPIPEITQELRDLCAFGKVEIEVLISEEGSVIEAKAISGDELLHDAALAAAKQATFRSFIDGPQVRSRGIVIYNFPSEKKCVDVGNVNGKWITRPSFSVHPHAIVSKTTEISIRIGIDVHSGNVLAAKASGGHPLIRASLEK